MIATAKRKNQRKNFLWIAALAIVLALAVTGAYFFLAGKSLGLGLRGLPRAAVSLVRSLADRQEVLAYSHGNYENIIFLHHSTGNNLVEHGKVRELFTEAGYAFWDQGYNFQGLRDPQGKSLGYGYTVPRDNTDPDGLAGVFRQRAYNLPMNALSGLLQHEVIIVKSCFAPGNQIPDDASLEQLKSYYLGMRATMQAHPDRLFILMTTPPLNPAETNPEQARRARDLANWLMSGEFQAGVPNLVLYDFFDRLAIPDSGAADANMLRPEYRWGADSHPNVLANEEVGPEFVSFVTSAIEAFRTNR